MELPGTFLENHKKPFFLDKFSFVLPLFPYLINYQQKKVRVINV